MALTVEEVLFRVSQDVGPFLRLGGSFKSGGAPWTGPAIASPLAVYLIKNAKAQQHGYGGGLVGAILAQALAKDDGISTCSTEDMPLAVKDFVYPKGKVKSKDVVIIPRATVSFVKSAKWNNVIDFTAGNDRFSVSTNPFVMWKRARQLQELGWTLNEAMIPEAEAVHDTRVPELRKVRRKPLWLMIALIGLAIFIVGMVIVVAVATH